MTFAGLDIAELSRLPLEARWPRCCDPYADGTAPGAAKLAARASREGDRRAAHRRTTCVARIATLLRPRASATSRSSAARRRCRRASCSGCAWPRRCARNLFGVVYVLDEPSAGLHPADTEALLARARPAQGVGQLAVRRRARPRRDPPRRLDRRRRARRRASTAARCSTAARPPGWRDVDGVADAALPVRRSDAAPPRTPRAPRGWLRAARASRATTCTALDVAFPLGVFTAVTGVSGSGKSSLVSQALVELVARAPRPRAAAPTRRRATSSSAPRRSPTGGRIARGHRARSGGWCASTRSRSAARRAPTSPPTPACSTTCASCSPPRKAARARRYDAGPLLVQRRQGPLRDLRGRGLRHASSCCSCPASTRRARPATARATTRRRWRSRYQRQEHRRRAGA